MTLTDAIESLVKGEVNKKPISHIFLMNNYQYLVDQLNSIPTLQFTLKIDEYNSIIDRELLKYIEISYLYNIF